MKINLHIDQPDSAFINKLSNNLKRYQINPFKLDFFHHLNSLLVDDGETIIDLFIEKGFDREYLYCYQDKPALFDLHIDSFSFKDQINLNTNELNNLLNLFNSYLCKSFKFILNDKKIFLLSKIPLNLGYSSLFDLTYNPRLVSIKNKDKEISNFLNIISMIIHEHNSVTSNQNKFNNLIFINGGKISEQYLGKLSTFYFNNFFKKSRNIFNQIDELAQTNSKTKIANFVLINPSLKDYEIIEKYLIDINQIFLFGINGSYKLNKQNFLLNCIYRIINPYKSNEIKL